MPLFKKVTIVGVGLLGGSLGLAIKKKRVADEVVGYFRNSKKIALAVARGAVDRGTDDLADAVRGCDLVILCTPVRDILGKLRQLKQLGVTALITDTGSTKKGIMDAARELGFAAFVGSHPLAGSEQSGLESASAGLFEKTVCIMTAGPASAKVVGRIAALWKKVGARPVLMKPSEHDQLVAFISHLPHAVAFALIQTIPAKMIPFAAGGLRDTTRIALSHPLLWSDIFLSNKKSALKAVTRFEEQLRALKTAIAQDDHARLLRFFSQARDKRRALARRS